LGISERRYRGLFDNFGAGVVVHAPNTSILTSNPRAAELLGLSIDQMRGKKAIYPRWKFLRADGTDLPLKDYPVNRVIASRKPFKNVVLAVCRPEANDVVWLTVNGLPVFDSNGELSEVLISFIDITERKKAEELVKQQLEEMKALDKMKTDFMNVAAHELKSPLIPIRTYVQMLADEQYGPLTSSQKEVLENVLRNAKRLQNLIGKVIDTLKLESKYMKFEFKKTNVASVVRIAAENYREAANQKGIKIETDIGKMPKIDADENRLLQVLTNLTDNAIKFTDKGKIKLSARKKGGLIVISVMDTGIGMSGEQLSHIFEKFYQAETGAERKAQGTGLGLTICKGIVEAHGGTIRAESAGLGKGATFTIQIPIRNKPTEVK